MIYSNIDCNPGRFLGRTESLCNFSGLLLAVTPHHGANAGSRSPSQGRFRTIGSQFIGTSHCKCCCSLRVDYRHLPRFHSWGESAQHSIRYDIAMEQISSSGRNQTRRQSLSRAVQQEISETRGNSRAIYRRPAERGWHSETCEVGQSYGPSRQVLAG